VGERGEDRAPRRHFSSYTKVYSVIYDSGPVPDQSIFSPRGTSPKTLRPTNPDNITRPNSSRWADQTVRPKQTERPGPRKSVSPNRMRARGRRVYHSNEREGEKGVSLKSRRKGLLGPVSIVIKKKKSIDSNGEEEEYR